MLGINTTLLTNGAIDTVTTGWTASAGATLTCDVGAPQAGAGNLRVASTAGALATAYQDVTTKVGHFYKLTAYFKKGTADGGRITIGTTADDDAIFASAAMTDAAWTQKTIGFTATATTTRIILESTDLTAGEYSEFDTLVMHSESHSLQDIFSGGELEIRTGSQPATADTAPSGTLLVTIKNGGATGVTFDDSASAVISKAAAETWNGTCAATGTAGWFRLCLPTDADGASTTEVRIDGAIATSGSQLNMTSTSFVTGAVETIGTFTLTFPFA